MIEPLVSIALCTYNGARFLRKQLDSLLAQTYMRFEIIAVDDYSTDETMVILEEYQRRDARLRVWRNSSNVGFKRNFQLALSYCHGEFIAPCDQDDIWMPEKIEMLVKTIGDCAMAYCDSELIDLNDNSLRARISDCRIMASTEDPIAFAITNCVSAHAMLFRAPLASKALPIPDCFFHDWWFAAVAASAGGIKFCDKSLVLYRQHDDAVTDLLGMREKKWPPGVRSRELREVSERLSFLATLNGPHQQLITKFCDLWRARETQWLSPRLALFMARHGSRIFALQKQNKNRYRPIRRSMKFLMGLRLKRLTNKYAYASP